MISKREYRISRTMLSICWVFLVISIGMLGWILYRYTVSSETKTLYVIDATINVALFSLLIIRFRKTVRKYNYSQIKENE